MNKISKISPQKNDSIEDPGSIFVGGFSCSTTHFHLKKYFSKFGPIRKINMAKNKKGGSKGYCFVIFHSQLSAKKALNCTKVELRGRKLSCRPIMTGGQLQKAKEKIDERRITVSNFPANFQDPGLKKLRTIFSKYGGIENIYFAKELKGREKKALTLFITFFNRKSIDASLESNVIIDGNLLEVERYVRQKSRFELENAARRSLEERQREEIRKFGQIQDNRDGHRGEEHNREDIHHHRQGQRQEGGQGQFQHDKNAFSKNKNQASKGKIKGEKTNKKSTPQDQILMRKWSKLNTNLLIQLASRQLSDTHVTQNLRLNRPVGELGGGKIKKMSSDLVFSLREGCQGGRVCLEDLNIENRLFGRNNPQNGPRTGFKW